MHDFSCYQPELCCCFSFRFPRRTYSCSGTVIEDSLLSDCTDRASLRIIQLTLSASSVFGAFELLIDEVYCVDFSLFLSSCLKIYFAERVGGWVG